MANGNSISFKDALRVIPEFNGDNISLSSFLDACDEASEMIEVADQGKFAKLLRSKLTREARRSIQGQTFDTVEELKNFLKNLYAQSKTIHQLAGEMGNEFQKDSDSVLAFANRVREIGRKILEAESLEGPVEAAYKASVEANAVDCFKRVLKPDIEINVEDADDMVNIVKNAIRAERLVEAQRALRSKTVVNSSRKIFFCSVCNSNNHDAKNYDKQKLEVKICQICNRFGHAARNCFQVKNYLPNEVECQFCDKQGHSAKECPQLKFDLIKNINNKFEQTSINNPQIICNYCKKEGHMVKECMRRKFSEFINQGNEQDSPGTNANLEAIKKQTRLKNLTQIKAEFCELIPLD